MLNELLLREYLFFQTTILKSQIIWVPTIAYSLFVTLLVFTIGVINFIIFPGPSGSTVFLIYAILSIVLFFVLIVLIAQLNSKLLDLNQQHIAGRRALRLEDPRGAGGAARVFGHQPHPVLSLRVLGHLQLYCGLWLWCGPRY